MTADESLRRAWTLAETYLRKLKGRPVGALMTFDAVRARLATGLSETGVDPVRVIEELSAAAEPGLVATPGPRFFGFVIGGSLPAALAADQLVSAWDQNAALAHSSPASAAVESVAAEWLLDILGLPKTASVGFVTGCQMANFTCLAAARDAVLRRAGWDVERNGLQGAPTVNIVVGDEAHATIFSALRYLGFGSERAVGVAAEGQGRLRPDELAKVLASVDGPTIVCAQAGNVNTGAFDDVDAIASHTKARGAWLHIDGAFGLWAAASPALRHLTRGMDRADSWATDGHKWLNVPYDCGVAIVADADAHRAAMTKSAAYLIRGQGAERDPHDFTPESSRRARGFAVYAALRSLGRAGVSGMIERGCHLASRMALRIDGRDGARVINDVVLNQVLVRFEPPDRGDADAFTRAVIQRVQEDRTCWLGGTRWHDQDAMRIAVSNWSTTEADIDRSADAILACARSEADRAR